MRISLKQLAVLVMVLTLAISVVVSTLRLREAKQHISTLQEQIGYKRELVDEDHYLLSMTGVRIGDSTELTGSHLLRVDNYSKYCLECTFYDGENTSRKTERYDLNDPLVAITFLRQPTGKVFQIQSTFMVNRKTFGLFHVDSKDHCFFQPMANGGRVADGDCFLYYFFYSDKLVPKPTAQDLSTITPLTEERMLGVADEFEMQVVFFRVVPRSDQ